LIIASRRFGKLDMYQLKKIGVIIKRAQYFITCRDPLRRTINEIKPEYLKKILVSKNNNTKASNQISLLFP
jgi:predicted DNA-binding helix-hairpin-helix protein